MRLLLRRLLRRVESWCIKVQDTLRGFKWLLRDTTSYREADWYLTSPTRSRGTLKIWSCDSSRLIWSGSDSIRHRDTQTDDKVTFIYSGSQNSTISPKSWYFDTRDWALIVGLWTFVWCFSLTLAIFLCTIILIHQIYSLIIIPSSIYNHFFSRYVPSTTSRGFNNLIRYYCRTPVAIHKVDGCEEKFLRKTVFWETFWGSFFFSLYGEISPLATNKTALAPTSLTTSHGHYHKKEKKKKKKGTSQEISSSSPMKKIQNV